jgi:AcrR family transcriptional regulator
MPRPPKFSRGDALVAAGSIAAADGPSAVTMALVAAQLGAPTGSIYHRFASRDELMAETWLSAAESFQPGFIAALHRPASQPGLEAALHAIEWARAHPVPARLVVLYRRRDFFAGLTPEPLRGRAERLAGDLDAALSEFAASALGSSDLGTRQLAGFLLIDMPQAAVRRYLSAGMEPPSSVDQMVRRTFLAFTQPKAGAD